MYGSMDCGEVAHAAWLLHEPHASFVKVPRCAEASLSEASLALWPQLMRRGHDLLLPEDLQSFRVKLSEAALALRQRFPHSLLVYHTAAMVGMALLIVAAARASFWAVGVVAMVESGVNSRTFTFSNMLGRDGSCNLLILRPAIASTCRISYIPSFHRSNIFT